MLIYKLENYNITTWYIYQVQKRRYIQNMNNNVILQKIRKLGVLL